MIPCPDCGGTFHNRPTKHWPGRLVCDRCTRIRPGGLTTRVRVVNIALPAWDEAAERARFEKWVGSPPFEYELTRFGPEGAWPDNYVSISVQLAWEAWKERGNIKSCPSCGLPHEDCGLTFDGLPGATNESPVADRGSAEPGVRPNLPGGV